MQKYFVQNVTRKVVTISRWRKRLIMVCADLLALPFALWSGYALRLSDWWPESYLVVSWPLFLVLPFIGVFIFMRLGLYRAVVRFMGVQAIWAVFKGVFLLAVLLWLFAFLLKIAPFPRSVPIIFALVGLVYVGGSRLLIRNFYHWLLKHFVSKDAVLIYGAGGAGVQLATALADGREYYPVGFIDDDNSLWGATIKNLPVNGRHMINEYIKKFNIKLILLAIPNTSNRERKKILEYLNGLNVHIQTIPSMPDLLTGQAIVSQLREVQIEELLGRDPVIPIPSLMSKCINDKVVMITGAGGSIGSELCRQALKLNPKALVLYEINEYQLYKIQEELKKILDLYHSSTPIYALLGSIADINRVKKVLSHYSIDTIYHAAAYKHVPIVEHNLVEGIKNNIFGTHLLSEQAANKGVENFIFISTDKAVRPTNIMGATKRFAELVLQNISNKKNRTIFSMVRFGNVLGSSGSVIPLFRKQIKNGGPITVTHEEVTRYFMTIPEAASLVIQAGSMAEGGDVFVLDMGDPIKIIDLAKKMVLLSGLEINSSENPEGDIEIQYTGLRAGEKLYEELLISDEIILTEHSKIMKANEAQLSDDEIQVYLQEMKIACDDYDYDKLREILKKAIIGYSPYGVVIDYLA